MNTLTPRDNDGRFQSWNTRVDEAGQYDARDAALATAAMAVGVLIWEGAKHVWDKMKKED